MATSVGYSQWVTPKSGVPQGGVEGLFLYLLAMLPLMRWVEKRYLGFAVWPLTSPP